MAARDLLRAKLKKFMFYPGRAKRSVDEMNKRVLSRLGIIVKRQAQIGIGRGSGKISKSAQKRTGAGNTVEFLHGLYEDQSHLGSGTPRPAGQPIRSWAPKRFIYNDIVDFYDASGPSVVIGTYKTLPWLAQLHEVGGEVRQTAWRIGVGGAHDAYLRRRAGRSGGRPGAIRWQIDKAGPFRFSKSWDRTSISRTAHYPARPFMGGAARVRKAVADANQQWKSQLRAA